METNRKLRTFWRQLETAQEAVLLLDYDGTLAPFTVIRSQALPYTGVPELLSAIQQDTETRLVIISGRAIDELLPLLDLTPQPEIWGCHGWEWLSTRGERVRFDLPGQAESGLDEALSELRRAGLESYCEGKPASVAVHWRGLDKEKAADLRRQALRIWKPIAVKYQLEIHPFNGGIELRCPGQDKGTALGRILHRIDPQTPVAFLGDDMTDEDGFTAIRDRGLGVLVNDTQRKTNAQHRIRPPEGLIDFLSIWHEKAPKKRRPARSDR